MDAISNMGFDFVASGHYAKVIHEFTEQTSGLSVLQLSEDMVYLKNCQYRLLIFEELFVAINNSGNFKFLCVFSYWIGCQMSQT